MRWRSPKEGTKRTIKKFAWTPTRLTNRDTVWMEPYVKTQEFVVWEGEGVWGRTKLYQESKVEEQLRMKFEGEEDKSSS